MARLLLTLLALLVASAATAAATSSEAPALLRGASENKQSGGGGSVTAPGVNITWGNGGVNITQSPAAGSSSGGAVIAPGVNVTWGDGGANVTQDYPPPRSVGTQGKGKGNTTVTLDARGAFRNTDGNCHWCVRVRMGGRGVEGTGRPTD